MTMTLETILVLTAFIIGYQVGGVVAWRRANTQIKAAMKGRGE